MYVFFLYIIFNILILIYWTVLLRNVPIHQALKKEKKGASVSVIIACKDELENLKENLYSILHQEYVSWELIIIDDYSSDGSHEYLVDLSQKYSHLTVIRPSKDVKGKKLGLTEAIIRANGEYILLTDADCKPSGTQWIQAMMSSRDHADIVLGYAPLTGNQATGVELFSKYETYITAIHYLSFSQLGRPYMGVGRNLLFSKKIWLDHQGYADLMHVGSGDDDLLIQKIATGDNTAVCTSPESFMYSNAEYKLKPYINQKKRHFNSSGYYDWGDKIALAIYPILLSILYLLFFIMIWEGYIWFSILLLLTRWILTMIIHYSRLKHLHYRILFWRWPILELCHLFYLWFFVPVVLNKKEYGWK